MIHFWGMKPKQNIWLGWKSCWLSPGDRWQIRTLICLVGKFDGFYHSKSSLDHHLAEYVWNFFQTSYAKLSLGPSPLFLRKSGILFWVNFCPKNEISSKSRNSGLDVPANQGRYEVRKPKCMFHIGP